MPDPSGGPPAATTQVGEMRWLVYLVTRQEVPDPNGSGILELLTHVRQVHAKIEPIRPMAFWASRQVDTPVTHLIVVRWLDYLDETTAILRQTRRPSDGAIRSEVFRVRRIMEEGGRKRFLRIEAELEDAGWTAPGAQVPTLPGVVFDTNGNPLNVTADDP